MDADGNVRNRLRRRGGSDRVRRPLPATASTASPLPPPEEIFADWLVWLPADADLEAAARIEIERLIRRSPLGADARCLLTLFQAVANPAPASKPDP